VFANKIEPPNATGDDPAGSLAVPAEPAAPACGASVRCAIGERQILQRQVYPPTVAKGLVRTEPGLERSMNPIETVMTRRSTEVKVVLAVAVLVNLLLATGSSIGSPWLIPVIVVVLWIAVQQGLRYRHNRSG
jgi:hypothetical protein